MNNLPPFIFFGTPYVARDTLELLQERGMTPACIVTAPPAPKGRGLALAPSEVAVWAAEHGLETITPEKLTPDVVRALQERGFPFAIVVAYGKIFPEALIESFPQGALNIHYSLLPKYRGASPVEAALLAGEAETGVTIQKMVYELDAGDIIAQKTVAIEPADTTKTLRARLIEEGAALLADTLPAYLSGTLTPQPQDETQATKCGKVRKEAGELSLAGNPEQNWNTYRAYAESPGTYFYALRGDTRIRVKIREAKYENGAFTPVRIVPESKQEMAYADFARSIDRAL